MIEVNFRDVSAMSWLNRMLGDSFEEKSMLIGMKPFLKADDVVWDNGANSGLLSYNLPHSFDLGELHLSEPNPRMRKLASQAVSRFSNTFMHPFGINNRDTNFRLTIPDSHTTMATL